MGPHAFCFFGFCFTYVDNLGVIKTALYCDVLMTKNTFPFLSGRQTQLLP
jgi:hypothetical protein